MFIEGNASMIVLAPLLHPVAMAYGIDDIHFAMVYILTVQSIYTSHGNTDVCKLHTKCLQRISYKGSSSIYILFAIDIIVLTYIPQLTTFLVNVFY